jgi:two-component system, cell cycle sensor histidine kinase and response regulator CckA
MDAATKARAFEPFFTTKEKGKGTGLGLSTVYGVVKQSGGYIDIETSPGEGAAFKIYLPRTGEVAAVHASESEPKTTSVGNGTILIAEDETSLRTLACNILEACGYTVLQAADGEEALAISRKYRGAIEVLLTDVVMPGMGGKELARELSRERPGMRIIYMSGYTGQTFEEQWPIESGSFVLMKPFSRQELRQKVHEALDSVSASVPKEV